MNLEQRKMVTLSHEGSALENVGRFGKVHAAELTRCQIDGFMSALIRIEDQRSAAEVAFALADRVAGGIREANQVWPSLAAPDAVPVAAAPPADASKYKPASPFAKGFFWGVVVTVALFLSRAG